MQPLLQLKTISKTFSSVKDREVKALDSISLDVATGEFLSILGPSGCGKTTLLRTIAGLDAPTNGDIILEGIPMQGINPRLGLIFQEFMLLPWRTAVSNIEFTLELMGLDKKRRKQQAEKYIELIELEGFENRYPKELSGGMKQRVAIARSIISHPKILLMDEPFGSLDSQTRSTMQQFLLQLWRKTGMTILFVTHNVGEAVFLGQRLIIMSPRPARIMHEVSIDLEYPRNNRSQDYLEIRNRVIELMGSDTEIIL